MCRSIHHDHCHYHHHHHCHQQAASISCRIDALFIGQDSTRVLKQHWWVGLWQTYTSDELIAWMGLFRLQLDFRIQTFFRKQEKWFWDAFGVWFLTFQDSNFNLVPPMLQCVQLLCHVCTDQLPRMKNFEWNDLTGGPASLLFAICPWQELLMLKFSLTI